MKILAERLRSVRESQNKSQTRVGLDINLKNTTLSNYELEISSPSPELIATLAKYYGVSADYLLGISNNPKTHDKTEIEDHSNIYIKLGMLDDKRFSLAEKMVDFLLWEQINSKR